MRHQKGYTLIEMLVVMAIVAITLAVGLYNYGPAMRASRAKQATTALYDGIMRARSQAMVQNGDIAVVFLPGTRTITFTQSGVINNRIVLGRDKVDPGNPRDGADYRFIPLTTIQRQTREGTTTIDDLDVDGDGVPDSIPILNDAAVSLNIQQNGFINGINDVGAILIMNQNDLDQGDTSGERQYAIIVFSTGLIKRARHMPDGTWELF